MRQSQTSLEIDPQQRRALIVRACLAPCSALVVLMPALPPRRDCWLLVDRIGCCATRGRCRLQGCLWHQVGSSWCCSWPAERCRMPRLRMNEGERSSTGFAHDISAAGGLLMVPMWNSRQETQMELHEHASQRGGVLDAKQPMFDKLAKRCGTCVCKEVESSRRRKGTDADHRAFFMRGDYTNQCYCQGSDAHTGIQSQPCDQCGN